VCLLSAAIPGCGIRPKSFLSLGHPAPIVRARSAALGENLPEEQAVPALIGRLSDPDPVVRMTAIQALRRRTGQDLGFVPYADPDERARAVARWQAWWRNRQAGLAKTRAIP
jgi:HEAT repeat protein